MSTTARLCLRRILGGWRPFLIVATVAVRSSSSCRAVVMRRTSPRPATDRHRRRRNAPRLPGNRSPTVVLETGLGPACGVYLVCGHDSDLPV